jgi:hypothetical protein
VRCPPLQSYLDKLIDFALNTWKARKETEAHEEIDDPLDRR